MRYIITIIAIAAVTSLSGCGFVCAKRTDPPTQHLDHSAPGWTPVIAARQGQYGGETLTCTGWRFRSPGSPDLYDMY